MIVSSPTNVTVSESMPATFAAVVSGIPFPTLQWYRGSALIAGAINPSYTIPAATPGLRALAILSFLKTRIDPSG